MWFNGVSGSKSAGVRVGPGGGVGVAVARYATVSKS